MDHSDYDGQTFQIAGLHFHPDDYAMIVRAQVLDGTKTLEDFICLAAYKYALEINAENMDGVPAPAANNHTFSPGAARDTTPPDSQRL